jgi:O-antigen/teichoic acid export membrane protein
MVQALRWSERYMKTDMVYLAHGGFWLVVGKVVALVAGFALSVAFANLMQPEKYGVYKYVLALLSIAGTFSLAGMGTAVNQAAARGFEGALKQGFSASLRWSVGAALIAGAAAIYYLSRGNSVLGISLLVGGAFSPLISAASLYDNYLGGMQRFTAKAWYALIRNFVPVLVLVPALFLTNNPSVFVVLYFASTLGTTLFCYADVLRRYQPHEKVDEGTLTFSKHLSVMGIVATVAAQLDRVLVFSQLGGTALALYSFAEMGPDQVRGASNIINSLAFPKMSRRPIAEMRSSLWQKALLLFIATGLVAALYIAVAPFIFHTFFPRYLAAVPYSQVYALTLLGVPAALFGQVFVSHMKKAQMYAMQVVPPLFRVVLMLVLLPIFGLWGIVWANVVGYAFAGVLQTVMFVFVKD